MTEVVYKLPISPNVTATDLQRKAGGYKNSDR